MSRDPALTMRDVQTILGHAHLSTTADVYMVEEQAQVIRRVATYLAQRERGEQQLPAMASSYDSAAMSVLFGGGPQ
jgi:integrase/recombinase XerD